jgi:hypothetical protein
VDSKLSVRSGCLCSDRPSVVLWVLSTCPNGLSGKRRKVLAAARITRLGCLAMSSYAGWVIALAPQHRRVRSGGYLREYGGHRRPIDTSVWHSLIGRGLSDGSSSAARRGRRSLVSHRAMMRAFVVEQIRRAGSSVVGRRRCSVWPGTKYLGEDVRVFFGFGISSPQRSNRASSRW